ncbi:glycosyl transferase family group 2-domain-containing protein [Epithele typhae]|uniref:glycosyl transferase family group 2-domain-containing protein n=1 Tax=Epithele typhae TaxID=378194 RepID=UPI0020073A06|nr:glycosyl transferase family group 2-domain-containing protein [Epithele typhae]KAH9938819.1 glycosyl transferase family group 2-domain-containing protein [Epithele typhae]
MDYDAYDALLHHIFRQTQGDAWFKPSEENIHAGVCLRVDNGLFRVFPYENPHLEPFEAAVRSINPVVAVKIRSAAIHAALATVRPDADAIHVDDNTRIQVVDSMYHLSGADKEQCGAFIRDERVLVVWSYQLDSIIPTCRDFEDKLIKLVWNRRSANVSMISVGDMEDSSGASDVALNEKPSQATETKEAAAAAEAATSRAQKPKKTRFWGLAYFVTDKDDIEKTAEGPSPRPVKLFAPFYNGLGVALSFFFIATGISVLLQESLLDGSWTRWGLLATTPFLFCVSLFFCCQIISTVSFCIGPVAHYHQNSKYYSAIKPAPNKAVDTNLPHITIQMPVYKESLTETIAPSVYSLKKAMQTYARQGGTSSIFINEDGMQLLSEEERQARIAFYADHNIGWVARPAHSGAPDGYKRAGRFKKASNMNFGLDLSLRLEKHLASLEALQAAGGLPTPPRADRDSQDAASAHGPEESLEDRALALAIEEVAAESDGRWRPWAANGRSLRVGEVILIVDSDTIVPEDCLRDAARELAECPDVAIIQHESDVMQVAHHYFENGIAHFTRRINKCISMGCANGEVAPFVGHNAFLRWSALQDAAFIDEADGKKKIWSEANVSEDFDMALRLQLSGYMIRWATYSDGGFKEGVSLTCDDELNRWQKYSYGCNELIFHPLIEWWRKGPITKQLRTFLWSGAPMHYKISMMAYMFSYYGLSASALLSVVNYFLLGWDLPVDGYYEHSFEIWLACTVVFPGAGNIGFTLLEYRLGQRNILASLVENLTWVPFFFFFFGGLSIHLSQALLAHLFSYNITWGATKKEVERSNFWLEVPKILKRFWISFVLSFAICIVMIILTTDLVPVGWRIFSFDWAVIVPLAIVAGCHIAYPIVLNPWFMIFSY